MSRDVVNITYKNISEFTPEDTLYIRLTENKRGQYIGQHPIFVLAQFIKFEKNKVTAKVISVDTNEVLWRHDIEEGWEVTVLLKTCSLYGSTVRHKQTSMHGFDVRGYAAYEKEEDKVLRVPERHPSYGMLSFNRSNIREALLFGSSVKSFQTITLKIGRGSLRRDYHQDSYHKDGNIIEVEMSEAQFAQAISSFNTGSGTPVTIRQLNSELTEPCPFISKYDQFNSEITDDMRKIAEDMEELMKTTSTILDGTKPVNKGEKELIKKQMDTLVSMVKNNIPYMQKQFMNQMDKTVSEAKQEIEIYLRNRASDLGIKPEQVKQVEGGADNVLRID